MVRYLHRRSKSAFEFLDLQPNVAASPSLLLGTRQRSSSKPSCSHNNHIPIMMGMGVRQLWSYTTYQLLMSDSSSDCIVSSHNSDGTWQQKLHSMSRWTAIVRHQCCNFRVHLRRNSKQMMKIKMTGWGTVALLGERTTGSCSTSTAIPECLTGNDCNCWWTLDTDAAADSALVRP